MPSTHTLETAGHCLGSLPSSSFKISLDRLKHKEHQEKGPSKGQGWVGVGLLCCVLSGQQDVLNTQGTRPLQWDGCTACKGDGQKAHTRHQGSKGWTGWRALAFTGVLNRGLKDDNPHSSKSGMGLPVAQGFSQGIPALPPPPKRTQSW